MIFKKALDAQQAHLTADKAPYFEMCCTRWVSKRPAESGPCPSRDLQARELLNGHEVYDPLCSNPFCFWLKDTRFFPWSFQVQQSHWTESEMLSRWQDHETAPMIHMLVKPLCELPRLHFQAGMQRRRPKQVENSARLGGKPANLGFASLLRANFNKMYQNVFFCRGGIHDSHFCWLLGFCQFHLGTLNIVSGQVHKSLQTIRSHVSCCVRFRVSSFIRPSAIELQDLKCHVEMSIWFQFAAYCDIPNNKRWYCKRNSSNNKKTTTTKNNKTRDIQSQRSWSFSFQRYVSRGEHVSMFYQLVVKLLGLEALSRFCDCDTRFRIVIWDSVRSWASEVKQCQKQQHLQVDIHDFLGDMKLIYYIFQV